MTSIKQFYLLKLIEECSEVAQVACKQTQFGKHSNNQGKLELTNCQHLRAEINDMLAVIDVLVELGELPKISQAELIEAKEQKRARIQRYLQHSQNLGYVEKDFTVAELPFHDEGNATNHRIGGCDECKDWIKPHTQTTGSTKRGCYTKNYPGGDACLLPYGHEGPHDWK